MNNTEIVLTADGSNTLFVPGINEQYHSLNGAITESKEIYISAGLAFMAERKREIKIFEMGLGTGLNALLSMDYACKNDIRIKYTAIEAFPIDMDTVMALNFKLFCGCESSYENFLALHDCKDDLMLDINDCFSFMKIIDDFRAYSLPALSYDLVYYDAFAPKIQEDLWSQSIFEKLFAACLPGAVIVTYSSAGRVKRNLAAAGFLTELLPGPPGKREFIRAIKP